MTAKKVVFPLLAFGLVTIAAFFFYTKKSTEQKRYTTEQVTQIISEVYAGTNGFAIQEQERLFVEHAGGAPTYGEIVPTSLATLLDDLQLTALDVFFDLGSGIGKVCVQVALTTPAQAVGVELASSRYQAAQQIKEELIKKNILTDRNKLQFIEANIAEVDLGKGTVFFLCSTCFSDALMKTLTDHMARSSKSAHVITLRPLPENDQFSLEKTYHLKMTWSESTPVYLYKKTQSDR